MLQKVSEWVGAIQGCLESCILQGKQKRFHCENRQGLGCILSPCLFNFYAEYIMRNAGLEEAQLESRLWEKHQ